ncbi:MAG: TetR/AcrR family transcriptional regulator [Defluviitaleaceae bacterium]|nr:TetR/AcrR family transcriptional regulator [Defluviitaleaceae bacterium]
MSTSSDTHREDILRAAIAEFGRVGYAAASTNEIIKQAKVSKGLLFHHFTNKEKLYTACHMHVMEQFGRGFSGHIDLSVTDFFERLLYSLKVKMELGYKYPEFLAFMNRAWYFDADNIPLKKEEIEALVADVVSEQSTDLADLWKGIDTTKFKDKFELSKILDYTRLIMDASWKRFSHKHRNDTKAMLKDVDSYVAEVEEMIELLRDGAYK